MTSKKYAFSMHCSGLSLRLIKSPIELSSDVDLAARDSQVYVERKRAATTWEDFPRVSRRWFQALFYRIDRQLHDITCRGHAAYNYAFSFPRVRPHRATNRGCHAWRADRHNLRARTRTHLIPIAPVRSEQADIRPARLIRRKDNRPIVS